MKKLLIALMILTILSMLLSCKKNNNELKRFNLTFYNPNTSFISNTWMESKNKNHISNVLGEQDIYKFTSSAGATINEIVYASIKEDGVYKLLTCCLAASSLEVDINGDGINEIIYTFGAPGPNTRILMLQDGEIVECDLNEGTKASSVQYEEQSNEFIINYAFDTTDYRYKYFNSQLIPVKGNKKEVQIGAFSKE